MNAVSDDEAESIHQTALRVLQELGVRVLLPEAREIFRAGGALVNEDDLMVRIGSDMVEAALASAPPEIMCRGGARHRKREKRGKH